MDANSDNTRMRSLLHAAQRGDQEAARSLLPLVYDELRRLASHELAKEPLAGRNATLQPTALVHEAYLKLVSGEPVDWQDKRHFFAAAAIAIRRILCDRARKRASIKHGGGRARVDLSDGAMMEDDLTPWPGTQHDAAESWEALDTALNALDGADPELAEVVNLRYFAGLSVEETAWALQVSTKTVDRRWKLARAWLIDRLERQGFSTPVPESG